MIALQVTRVGFDSLENSIGQARYSVVLGIFITDDAETADSKVKSFIATLPTAGTYKGWDHQYYPQYRVDEITIR